MAPRSQLQSLLETLLGSENVYFQPPPSAQMQYPAIVYERDTTDTIFADNSPYRHTKRYSVTIIDRSPDSEFIDKLANLPMCLHSRHFKADQLNHDTFTLFF